MNFLELNAYAELILDEYSGGAYYECGVRVSGAMNEMN